MNTVYWIVCVCVLFSLSKTAGELLTLCTHEQDAACPPAPYYKEKHCIVIDGIISCSVAPKKSEKTRPCTPSQARDLCSAQLRVDVGVRCELILNEYDVPVEHRCSEHAIEKSDDEREKNENKKFQTPLRQDEELPGRFEMAIYTVLRTFDSLVMLPFTLTIEAYKLSAKIWNQIIRCILRLG